MGALGDWGAHIIDTAHQFLNLGLPTEVDPVMLRGHNSFFFPMSSTLVFKFPARGNMPSLDITWYDGVDNVPQVPAGFGTSDLDPNIPPTSVGKIQPAKLNPGKEIYSKDLIFKGGSHGSALSIIPAEKAKEMESKLPEVPKSPSNHYANFLKACLAAISNERASESTGWYEPSLSTTLRLSRGKPASGPLTIASRNPFSIAGIYSFGILTAIPKLICGLHFLLNSCLYPNQ